SRTDKALSSKPMYLGFFARTGCRLRITYCNHDDPAIRHPRYVLRHCQSGVKCGPDGLRADVFGNLSCSASGPLGYAGVLVYNAQGKMIGRIRLPEICANLCFGGPKRNQLLMTASQSVYLLQVNTQGAAPG